MTDSLTAKILALEAEVSHWREANRSSLAAGDILLEENRALRAEAVVLISARDEMQKMAEQAIDELSALRVQLAAKNKAGDALMLALERSEVALASKEEERNTAQGLAARREIYLMDAERLVDDPQYDYSGDYETVLCDKIAALHAALAAAQKDAERYHWLKESQTLFYKPTKYDGRSFGRWTCMWPTDNDDLDAAIDEAKK